MGVVGCADDLLLLAPSRKAAQVMLRTCEKFTVFNNIQFPMDPDPTSSKSKAIYVVGPQVAMLPQPAPLLLCGQPLP